MYLNSLELAVEKFNSGSCTHSKCLQGFTVFPAISMKKGCKNHRQTLYSSNGKIVYVVGNPVIFSDQGEILQLLCPLSAQFYPPCLHLLTTLCSPCQKFIQFFSWLVPVLSPPFDQSVHTLFSTCAFLACLFATKESKGVRPSPYATGVPNSQAGVIISPTQTDGLTILATGQRQYA